MKSYKILALLHPRNWLVFFIAILFYSPISINALNVGSKPIDIVFSDLVCSFLCFFYIVKIIFFKTNYKEIRNFLIIVYALLFFFCLASLGFIEKGNSVIFFSFIKYVKIFVAIIAGMGLARLCSIEDFWKMSVWAAGGVILILLYSQLIIKGNISPRWGEMFLIFKVYGFPNSSASYLIILFMYIITAWMFYRKLIYAFIASLAAAFMILSLSRSAIIVLIIFIALFFAIGTPLKKVLMTSLVLLFVVGGMSLVMKQSGSLEIVQDALKGRYVRTFESDDISSGRFEIARETIALVYQRPLTGFFFDSFDNYHYGHSTPHNQYLEALFKTGIIGFVVYFSVIIIFLRLISHRMKSIMVTTISRSLTIGLFCTLFALSAGNFTQPNFTYSQTGNVIFLTIGFLAYAMPKKESDYP